jgi:hypothetical protein
VQVFHHEGRPPIGPERTEQILDRGEQASPVSRKVGRTARFVGQGWDQSRHLWSHVGCAPAQGPVQGGPTGRARQVGEGIGDRPVRQRLRQRKTSAGQHQHVWSRAHGLGDQSCLADPGVAGDHRDLSGSGLAAQHPAEAVQLAAAADELRPRHVPRSVHHAASVKQSAVERAARPTCGSAAR